MTSHALHPGVAPIYHDPDDHGALVLKGGELVSASGRRYPVTDGIPQLLSTGRSYANEIETAAEYDRIASGVYDAAMDWLYKAFLVDEHAVHEGMLDMLGIESGDRVLEVGCGTGRDSFRLARRLGAEGLFCVQDISPNMVHECRRRMDERHAADPFQCRIEYSVSSGTALPFADGFFDKVFHFGGFNQFGDLKLAASEVTRVTRVGGRVVFGDEAVAPWLKGSEFDAIVSANNPLFRADIPLHVLPDCAADVSVRWVIANCFYMIGFTRGPGTPAIDLDHPHAGRRGGTMRSRYFGVLDGVTPDAKAQAAEAAAREGKSLHEWLTQAITRAASTTDNKPR